MKSIAIFCGASSGQNPVYLEEARTLGKVMADENITLVYGGSRIGIMGAVANGVLENGGNAIGVIPKKLLNVEVSHQNLTELHIVDTMHERKALMAERADAFIALPGGIGTLEEWFEAFTWAQIGYHSKPCCLLNTNNYYTPMLELFEHMIEQGFVKKDYKELILVDSSPKRLIDLIKSR